VSKPEASDGIEPPSVVDESLSVSRIPRSKPSTVSGVPRSSQSPPPHDSKAWSKPSRSWSGWTPSEPELARDGMEPSELEAEVSLPEARDGMEPWSVVTVEARDGMEPWSVVTVEASLVTLLLSV
jgi:hypothetical protein